MKKSIYFVVTVLILVTGLIVTTKGDEGSSLNKEVIVETVDLDTVKEVLSTEDINNANDDITNKENITDRVDSSTGLEEITNTLSQEEITKDKEVTVIPPEVEAIKKPEAKPKTEIKPEI